MAIDWDAAVLRPVMDVFGEGNAADQSTLPLYTPVGGAAFRLADAVFDRAYADVTLDGDGTENTTRKPCLGVRDILIPGGAKQNDKVFIPSENMSFIVKDPRPDGHGHSRLILMALKS